MIRSPTSHIVACTYPQVSDFQVVVEGVETDSVAVQWQCRAYSKDGAGLDKEQPPYIVTGDDMKRYVIHRQSTYISSTTKLLLLFFQTEATERV